MKTCANSPCVRFCFEERHPEGRYIACELDKMELRCWKGDGSHEGYWRLAHGTHEERNLYYRMMEKSRESEDSMGFDLTDEECARIRGFLSEDVLEAARCHDNPKAEFMTMDGRTMVFYAELDNGRPPVSIKEEVFWGQCMAPEIRALYEWLIVHFGLWGMTPDLFGRWDKKRRAEVERAMVQKALDDGIEAVDSLLYDGKASQIRLIEELEHERPLSYVCDYPECFTVRMGQSISRSCKMYRVPNCVRVFGEAHEFD